MRKVFDTSIFKELENLPEYVQLEYLRLYMGSDEAGVIDISQIDKSRLESLNHVSNKIILKGDLLIFKDYIKNQFGTTLKPSLNAHGRARSSIEKRGLKYDYDKGEFDIDDPGTLPIPSKQMRNEMTLAKIKNSNLLELFQSKGFAIWLALGLMLVQTFHTSEALLDLTSLPQGVNYSFAILTALLMDFLILYFVSNNAKLSSFIALLFAACMNIYSYHLEIEYFTYKSCFAFIAAVAVPLAVHRVASTSKVRS